MQESFQLAHETLYLAVVMTDLYMSKRDVRRDEMQLIGATAILLSSKFYVSLLLFLYFIRVYTCFFKKKIWCFILGTIPTISWWSRFCLWRSIFTWTIPWNRNETHYCSKLWYQPSSFIPLPSPICQSNEIHNATGEDSIFFGFKTNEFL